MSDLERVLSEQQECREYLNGAGLDRAGAMHGASDWLHEETLLRIAESEKKTYKDFLNRKSQLTTNDGFKPLWMPSFLFDFQAHVTDWSLWKGRGAEFLDCGMGKTPMKLVWAENIVRHTNRPVLDLNPLGVVAQTIREAEKFGGAVSQVRTGA